MLADDAPPSGNDLNEPLPPQDPNDITKASSGCPDSNGMCGVTQSSQSEL